MIFNENYMEEIRTALSMAGMKPPYVLMPHSVSGVYSESLQLNQQGQHLGLQQDKPYLIEKPSFIAK